MFVLLNGKKFLYVNIYFKQSIQTISSELLDGSEEIFPEKVSRVKRPRAAAQDRKTTENANIEKLDKLLHRQDANYLSFSEEEDEGTVSEQTNQEPREEKLTGAAKRKVNFFMILDSEDSNLIF